MKEWATGALGYWLTDTDEIEMDTNGVRDMLYAMEEYDNFAEVRREDIEGMNITEMKWTVEIT